MRFTRRRAGRGAIVVQLAISFALIASLVLVGRSLQRFLSSDPGFRADGVLVMQVSLPVAMYRKGSDVATFYHTLHMRLRELHGSSVAVVDELPLTGDRGRAQISRAVGLEPIEVVVRSVSSRTSR